MKNFNKASLFSRHLIVLITLFPVLAFTFYPLFHDGFFPTMDDIQVVRIEEMYKELTSGQFPVRIAMDLGNEAGYMLFQYYAPAVYYLGALFHLLGATLVISTKLTFLSGFILAWLGIYLLLKEKFEPIAVFFGSITFFASSYMGYDSFHRGALAEFYALAILPLVFFFLIKSAAKHNHKLYTLGASLSVALLIITHNLTTLITFPFIIALVFLIFKDNLKNGLGILILGALLSSFYWLPMVSEKNYIQIDQIDFIVKTYKNHFLTLPQLIGMQKINWGFMPPLLGLNLFAGSLIAFLLIFFQKSSTSKNHADNFIKFSIVSFFISLFMASTLSKPIWETLAPVLSFMQFPWRFLTLSTFFGSISCAYLIHRIDKVPLKIIVGIILIIPLFTIQYKYLRPLSYNYISKYTADDPCGTAGWSNEYLSVWTKTCLPKGHGLKPVSSTSPALTLKDIQVSNHGRNYEFESKGEGEVTVDKYYFPGWEVSIDNAKTAITPSLPHGLISFNIPEGNHKVKIGFKDTGVRTAANLLTLLGILISLVLFVTSKQFRRLSKLGH